MSKKKDIKNIRNARDSQNAILCAPVHKAYLLKNMRLLFAFCDWAFVRALFSMCSHVVHKRNSGCIYLKEEMLFEGVVKRYFGTVWTFQLSIVLNAPM